jgi:hypothetical protein
MRQTLKMVDPPFYFPLVDNDLGIVHLFGTGSATAHCDQGFTPVRNTLLKTSTPGMAPVISPWRWSADGESTMSISNAKTCLVQG